MTTTPSTPLPVSADVLAARRDSHAFWHEHVLRQDDPPPTRKDPPVPDPFQAARQRAVEDALLRRADPVPGAELMPVVAAVTEAAAAFTLAREQLRVAQNPEIDPAGRQGRDQQYLDGRRSEYCMALAELHQAAISLVAQVDDERGVVIDE